MKNTFFSILISAFIVVLTPDYMVVESSCEIESNPSSCNSMVVNGVLPNPPRADATLLCRRTSSRSFFLTSFGNDIKSPDFSAYKITRAEAQSLTSDRPWGWRSDPDIEDSNQVSASSRSLTGTSGSPCWGTLSNTRGFSWDRGHLAPNKIMSAHPDECEGQWATFYITNAAMQYDDMNRGSWESLESHVYEWLEEKSSEVGSDEIYIISGAVYEGRENSGDLRCDLDTGDNYARGSSSTTNFMAVRLGVSAKSFFSFIFYFTLHNTLLHLHRSHHISLKFFVILETKIPLLILTKTLRMVICMVCL